MDVDQIKTLRALNEKTGAPMSELVRRILAEFFKAQAATVGAKGEK